MTESSSPIATRGEYQPRFRAYAKAHGRSPGKQAACDERQSPGGCMTGYILWIGERWAVWRKARGIAAHSRLNDMQHAAFDAWLAGSGEPQQLQLLEAA